MLEPFQYFLDLVWQARFLQNICPKCSQPHTCCNSCGEYSSAKGAPKCSTAWIKRWAPKKLQRKNHRKDIQKGYTEHTEHLEKTEIWQAWKGHDVRYQAVPSLAPLGAPWALQDSQAQRDPVGRQIHHIQCALFVARRHREAEDTIQGPPTSYSCCFITRITTSHGRYNRLANRLLNQLTIAGGHLAISLWQLYYVSWPLVMIVLLVMRTTSFTSLWGLYSNQFWFEIMVSDGSRWLIEDTEQR